MFPVCFIPCESMESPAAANTVTPASTRYLRRFTAFVSFRATRYLPRDKRAQAQPRATLLAARGHTVVVAAPSLFTRQKTTRPELCLDGFSSGRFVVMFLHHLVARRPQLQEGLRLFVQALAVVVVEHRLPKDAVHGLRTEIIFIVEAMNGRQNIVGGQSWILNMRQLVSAFVPHLVVAHHKSVFHRVVIKLSARIRVRHRNLDGLYIEFLGECDGVVDGLVRLARQTQNEVSVDNEPQLVAVLSELSSAFDRSALLDIFQDLLVSRLVPHDQQAASRFFHSLQRFKVGGNARSAGPRQTQGLQLGAKFNRPCLLNVEGIIVEEKFLHVWP